MEHRWTDNLSDEPIDIETILRQHSFVPKSWFKEHEGGHDIYRQSDNEPCYICVLIGAVKAAKECADRNERDAEKYRLCAREGFPVRNQTENPEMYWTIGGKWYGPTPEACIDAALRDETGPEGRRFR